MAPKRRLLCYKGNPIFAATPWETILFVVVPLLLQTFPGWILYVHHGAFDAKAVYYQICTHSGQQKTSESERWGVSWEYRKPPIIPVEPVMAD
jgi:hypothetical protein